MADSFFKKENAKKKAKKKQDKVRKREERKTSNNKGKGFESMIAYVDERGNLSATPPGQEPQKESREENQEHVASSSFDTHTQRTGVLISFFDRKGFGFIKDDITGDTVFAHQNRFMDDISERDKVVFVAERTPKGYSAIRVEKMD